MSTTGIVLTACVIVLAVYDLIVVLRKGVGCSVSRAIQRVGFCSPIFSVCIGMLLGHFFLYLGPGQSVISIPEKTNEVTVVHLSDIDMRAVFIPDGIDMKLKDKETGKAVACPSLTAEN